MVVGLALAAVQMGMALPTGFLFGVGYGTGVRIGYEQVYPLLFPKGARPTTTELAATMKGMNTVYDAIGGKDASRMGIAVGITNAGEILNNPDFRVLEQLESSSSGPTSSSSLVSRADSGRGSLDLSDSSPDEIVLEEIEEFNKLTDAEMWTKIRAMSTGQILNSRTGTGMSQAWMSITGKVLLERTEAANAKLGTGPQTQSFNRVQQEVPHTSNAEFLIWNAKLNELTTAFGIAKQNRTAFIQRGSPPSVILKYTNQMRTAASGIRKLSNDYRNPNNLIRKMVLVLRQQLANGVFKTFI